jgi:hypothetical protein
MQLRPDKAMINGINGHIDMLSIPFLRFRYPLNSERDYTLVDLSLHWSNFAGTSAYVLGLTIEHQGRGHGGPNTM